MRLTIPQLTKLEYAISDVVGYLTDNSCCDADCCGGPHYSEDDYKNGLAVLRSYGIEVDTLDRSSTEK